VSVLPFDDTHMIVVRVTPTTHDRVNIETNSSHPDPQWTARALQLAAEAVLRTAAP
jgi:hypothetical protein